MIEVAKPPLKEYDAALIHKELMPLIGRLIRLRSVDRKYDYGSYTAPKVFLNDFTAELHDVALMQMGDKVQLVITLGRKEIQLGSKYWIGVYQRDSDEWRVIHEPTSVSIDSYHSNEQSAQAEAEKKMALLRSYLH